jgi:hypothetical protein
MEERIEVLESDLAYLYKKDIENRAAITKILENNEKILESLVYRNQEIDKKMSLMFNCIEFLCNKESDTDVFEFLTENAIDIYKCDTQLFCKMIAKQEIMTMGCANVFNLLFFHISFEELDLLLEEASRYNKNGDAYSKWFKLHFLHNLVLQGYSLCKNNDLNYIQGYPLPKNNGINYKIFLDKMYKIFNETDISSCPSPYNSKDQFLKNTIFKICYNEAKNM